MVGLLAPCLAALILACLLPRKSAGQSFSGSLRFWPLLVGAFVVELLLYNPPIDEQPWSVALGPWLWLATKLVMLGVAIANMRPISIAWVLVAFGLGLNALAIAANGGYMPQSVPAAIDVWGEERALALHADRKLENTVPMTSATHLNALGDVIPQPGWLPRANVVSIGDLLLSLGLACWTFLATRGGIVGMIGKPIHAGALPDAPPCTSR